MLEEVREVEACLVGYFPEIVVEKIGITQPSSRKIAGQPGEPWIAQPGDDDRPAAELGAEQILGDADLDIAKALAKLTSQQPRRRDIAVRDQQRRRVRIQRQ